MSAQALTPQNLYTHELRLAEKIDHQLSELVHDAALEAIDLWDSDAIGSRGMFADEVVERYERRTYDLAAKIVEMVRRAVT